MDVLYNYKGASKSLPNYSCCNIRLNAGFPKKAQVLKALSQKPLG